MSLVAWMVVIGVGWLVLGLVIGIVVGRAFRLGSSDDAEDPAIWIERHVKGYEGSE